MHSLKIDSFTIDVTDYCTEHNLLVFDIVMESHTVLDNLLHYAALHRTDITAVDYTFDGQKYHGHFGLFVYDLNLRVRLYMTTSIDDYGSYGNSYNIFNKNVISIINSHKDAIETIVHVLQRNNLLTPSDETKLSNLSFESSYDEIMLYHRVDDVDAYLQATQTTLDDIRTSRD